MVEWSANTSQKTPSSPDPRPPKTLRNRNRAIVQPPPALRFAVDVVSIAYRSPHRRPPLRSMRTDRLTLGRPRPPIADFWATAEHTTWLHRAFRWHVPRKCHAVPPLESLTTLAHVPPLSTRSRFGPSRNRRPPSHRTSQRLPRRRRPRRRTRPPFPCRDEFTFRKIRTDQREKIFGRTVSLRHNRGDSEEISEDTFIRAHRWARHILELPLAGDLGFNSFSSTGLNWPATSVRPTPTRRVATAKPRSPSRRANHSPASGRS